MITWYSSFVAIPSHCCFRSVRQITNEELEVWLESKYGLLEDNCSRKVSICTGIAFSERKGGKSDITPKQGGEDLYVVVHWYFSEASTS